MSNFIKELCFLLEENLQPTFFRDPDYLRARTEAAQLCDEIAAALGPDGPERLDALMSAEAKADEFWKLALFRRTLALGLELGRLPFSLTA